MNPADSDSGAPAGGHPPFSEDQQSLTTDALILILDHKDARIRHLSGALGEIAQIIGTDFDPIVQVSAIHQIIRQFSREGLRLYIQQQAEILHMESKAREAGLLE